MPERRIARIPAGRVTGRFARRDFLRFSAGALLLAVSPVGGAAGSSILAVRVWPARDYTRLTLEHDQSIEFNHFLVKNPDRLVIDLEGVELNTVLQNLPDKVSAADPYVKAVRAGRNKPGIVRLVIELKLEVKPQVFALKPIGDYAHRLVLDLHPLQPVDPLLALVEKSAESGAAPGAEAGEAGAVGRIDADSDAKAPPRAVDGGAEARSEPAAPKPRGKPARREESPPVARLITIVLDPGHGGEDPGAIGRGGSFEKHVTLAVARRLKARIDAEPNMRCVLTRDGDFFIPLQQRVSKARRVRADLFVSIHADAFVKPHARGSSVFVLSERGASSSAARWLAQRENAADLIGGTNLDVRDPYLARTLLDLSQTATINDSLELGGAVLAELGRVNTLHKPRVEQAGFAVLKAPDIPSILVETAFISNPQEEKRLNDQAYQEKMAEAIMRGIRRYFSRNPPYPKSKLALAD
jgi:N-acetylmuramoyl-L-alanine amidase